MNQILLIFAVLSINLSIGLSFRYRFKSILSPWLKNSIVPGIVPATPPETLQVDFDGKKVNLGNFFNPMEVQNEPHLKWNANPCKLYTIVFIDPDAPSRSMPTLRNYAHWLAGNVPGYDVSRGETLFSFVGSAPIENTDMHRYIFLVYEQPGELAFEGVPRINGRVGLTRGNFNLKSFTKHFQLTLVAGNFYMSQNFENP